MQEREPYSENHRSNESPYGSSVLTRLETMSPQAFANWLRIGIGVHETSLQRQYERPDFSGFDPLDSLFGDYSPLRTLGDIFKALSLKARGRFRNGLAELIGNLPAAADVETILVVPTALSLAGRVQAPEVFPELQRRVLLGGGWGSNGILYHRSFQFCQALASNSAAAPALRALIGKDKRNAHFRQEQVRSALRVLLRSEPQGLRKHLLFFEAELRTHNIHAFQMLRADILELIDPEDLAASLEDMPEWATRIITDPTAVDPVHKAGPFPQLVSSAVYESLILAAKAPDIDSKAFQYARALQVAEQGLPQEQTKVLSEILDYCMQIEGSQSRDLITGIEKASKGTIERILAGHQELQLLLARFSRRRSSSPGLILITLSDKEGISVGEAIRESVSAP